MVTLTVQRHVRTYLSVLVFALSSYTRASADSVPNNLGCGLYEVVRDSQVSPAFQRSLVRKTTQGERNLRRALKDSEGRIMVDIHLDGSKTIAQVRRGVASQPGVNILAEDRAFQAGTIEAYVTPDAAAQIAVVPGVTSVSLVWKPQANIGAVTTQGFIQHRVQEIAGKYDGTGIKVGALSDSFNAYGQSGSQPDANADVQTGDLPGPGNPFGNTTPVVVIEDYTQGADEGRAMLQIVEDLAPKAALGFATAFNGYIDFANNIRALKDVFGADVICDDVYYYAEPMFQDGPIAQAVDYVASKGAAYFSAAGNVPGVEAYDAPFNLVPFDPANPQTALKGTNINLTGVDPSLYAGGFHNFRTDGGQDIAQQCAPGGPFGNAIDFQWNDPYAYTKQSIGKLLLNDKGELSSATSSVTYNLQTTSANTLVRLEAGPIAYEGPDVVVAIIDPQGRILIKAYDYQLPTEVGLPAAGNYSVVVTPGSPLLGAFYVKINQVNVTPAPEITSNFNLLLFDVNGTYLGALSGDALATKQPILLQSFAYPFNFQLVIARSNVPTVAHPADHLRYLAIGFEVLNYGSYLTPASFGHNCAAGANGVAAYSAFRPFAPEYYTSPGPTTIYFDNNNNKLSTPEVRMRPNFAGMDGAYTTFFPPGGTTTQDASSFPNFFGTSAATPHVGGIAALVLQAHGGPGSVTPDQMRDVLQRSTFPHSLTPYHASGRAEGGGRTVTIQATSDYSDVGVVNANQFSVNMSGHGSISSLSINLSGADPTGGNIYRGYPGEVFTGPHALFGTGGYPFTVSTNSRGISNSDVKVGYSGQAPAPSIASEYYQLNLTFAPGKMNENATLRFGIAHLEHHSSYYASPTGTGGGDSSGGGAADLLGQGILLPSGQLVGAGATFVGVFDDGTSFAGSFTNQIGAGWTPLDGYGFINAQEAVKAPLKK